MKDTISKRDFLKMNILGAFWLWLNEFKLFSQTPPVKQNVSYFFADIHNHPTLKPIGKSKEEINSINPLEENSIWYSENIDFLTKAEDLALGFAAYSQSDLSDALAGNLLISGVSLYSPEVKFFLNKIGKDFLGKEFENFVSQFGTKRISLVESKNYDYFTDLDQQYKYLKQLNGKVLEINRIKCRYVLVNSYTEMLDAMNDTELKTIVMTLNIEGGHCFGPGRYPEIESTPPEIVIENVRKVKNWEFRPLYVTLAHHFFNELCGHTKSIPDELSKILDQSYGINTGFTKTGKEVLKLLLDNSNDDRILIDIKHFSIKCRSEFYQMLDSDYRSEKIPIVFSHGGVNGLESFSKSGTHIQGSPFNEWDISLFNDEIVRIAKSGGIIGLNFDKRIMASEEYLKAIPKSISRENMLFHWSKIIWNNIEHIAEVCDQNNLPAWDNISLGTDFDGIINPIDGYWTQEELPRFYDNLCFHALSYMKNSNLSSENRIETDEIISKVMQSNALNFYKKTLKT